MSERAPAATQPLPERRVRFEYPDDFDPAWHRRLPEFAAAANSVSLLMPFAEPYFVGSVRKALPELPTPLATRTEEYLRQELAHQRAHRRFNDLLLVRYPALRRVEGWARRSYGWLGRTRSLEFNLAFAAGSETIAYSIARWTEKRCDRLMADADLLPATLFMWHLAEEVEHKTAAYDVYEAVDGSRLRYVAASTVSVLLLVFLTTCATLTMLASDRSLLRPSVWVRLVTWAFSLAFEVLPTLAVSSLRRHHPSQLTDPTWMVRWLRSYDPDTATIATPARLSGVTVPDTSAPLRDPPERHQQSE
ncbi:MAG: metal-dependent hydrolase [Acidimicrobiia bacterium]|nr:metal-dependent hydrolase [Acidimicrobiia bacterium]